jgi:hypothetical protein
VQTLQASTSACNGASHVMIVSRFIKNHPPPDDEFGSASGWGSPVSAARAVATSWMSARMY